MKTREGKRIIFRLTNEKPSRFIKKYEDKHVSVHYGYSADGGVIKVSIVNKRNLKTLKNVNNILLVSGNVDDLKIVYEDSIAKVLKATNKKNKKIANYIITILRGKHE